MVTSWKVRNIGKHGDLRKDNAPLVTGAAWKAWKWLVGQPSVPEFKVEKLIRTIKNTSGRIEVVKNITLGALPSPSLSAPGQLLSTAQGGSEY